MDRIQLRRTKGWRMPADTVSVARPGPFGNPWTVAAAIEAGYGRNAAGYCVDLFREWLGGNEHSLTRMLDGGEARRARLLKRLPELRGKNLACWCKHGDPCHADVLIEMVSQ